MQKKIKKFLLERKYKKAKDIYIIVRWAKLAILTEKYYGKMNKENCPLIIQFNDHNGEYESYDIKPWNRATSGACFCYTFNKEEANKLLKLFKNWEGEK